MSLTDDIWDLARFEAHDYPVCSFYLDIDRRSFSPVKAAEIAHQLVRQARQSPFLQSVQGSGKASLERDLDRFTRFVGAELDAPTAKGVAVFACSEANLWKTVVLPAQVSSSVTVARHPRIRPLVELHDRLDTFAVVLVDREKARFFICELGDIEEIARMLDDVPGRVRPASHYGLEDRRIERHVDGEILLHLKHVAEVLTSLVAGHGLQRVVLAGTPDVVPQLHKLLPYSVAERVCGVARNLMIIADTKEVLRESLRVISDRRRSDEINLFERISNAHSGHDHGAVGVSETLAALYLQAVHVLAVDDGFHTSGCRCTSCGRLFTAQTLCPECGGGGERMDDLVDEAIRQAICQRASVKMVSEPTACGRLGGIAALLHYSVDAPRQAALLAR